MVINLFTLPMDIRTLPSISTGIPKNVSHGDHIIIQEKIDGSQLTVFRRGDELFYYNKNKRKDPSMKPWLNAWLSIRDKIDFFREGYYYHGEAMTTCLTNTNEYDRTPKNFWIVYEIVRQDNYVLSPSEMTSHLQGQFETVGLIYDSQRDKSIDNLEDFIEQTMNKIESGEIKSCLGQNPEGIVLKFLNRVKKGKKGKSPGSRYKLSTGRYKYVRSKFQESNRQRKKKISSVPTENFIKSLGEIYDTEARKHKAIQHLQENGKWKDGLTSRNMNSMIEELDRDLLKEEIDEIKNQLFIRFWPEISKSARGNIQQFFDKLGNLGN